MAMTEQELRAKLAKSEDGYRQAQSAVKDMLRIVNKLTFRMDGTVEQLKAQQARIDELIGKVRELESRPAAVPGVEVQPVSAAGANPGLVSMSPMPTSSNVVSTLTGVSGKPGVWFARTTCLVCSRVKEPDRIGILTCKACSREYQRVTAKDYEGERPKRPTCLHCGGPKRADASMICAPCREHRKLVTGR